MTVTVATTAQFMRVCPGPAKHVMHSPSPTSVLQGDKVIIPLVTQECMEIKDQTQTLWLWSQLLTS